MDNRRFFRQAMMLTLATGLLASCSKDNNSGEPDSGINNNDLVEIVPTIAIANQNAVTLDGPQDGLDEELTLYFVRGGETTPLLTYGTEIETTRSAGEDYQPLTFHPTQYYPVDGSNIKLWGWYPKSTTYTSGQTASVSWTFNGTQDIMLAQGKTCNITTTDLKFELEHLLTQLQFIIHTESDLAAATWGKITSIRLEGENSRCDFNIFTADLVPTTSPSFTGSETFTVTGSLDIQKKTQEELEAMTEAERAAYLLGTLMVAPKTSTRLTLYVTTENSNGEVEVDVTADASNTNAFKAGYATRVYLNFLPGKITATLKTGNWEAVTVDNVVLGEYPYVQRGYIVISKDLLGESSDPIHDNWAETPRHNESTEENSIVIANSVSASFEIATEDVECTWENATSQCRALGPNWRVPTERETELILMLSDKITQDGYTKPLKDGTGYWSATESNEEKAVYVEWNSESNTSLSEYGEKTETHKVRCIRDI